MIRPIVGRLAKSTISLVQSQTASSSTSINLRIDGDEPNSALLEPYGNDYGAGPSSRPYTPPSPEGAPSVRHSTLTSAAALRRVFTAKSAREANQDTKLLIAWLDDAGIHIDLQKLSRLEIHTILHQLTRDNRFMLAADFVTRVIRTGLDLQPKQRRLISPRSLRALFLLRAPQTEDDISAEFFSPVTQPMPCRPPLDKPMLEEQAPPSVPKSLRRLLALLDSLRTIRNPRPFELYDVLITECSKSGQLRPDIAARVYVDMVEEWVMEGRIAEGAEPDDFEEGGAPPRVLEDRELKEARSDFLKLWWKGIRSWALPGEVMSPHERLDLWHPRHLALKEKLRSFPYPNPASPPTLVPPPNDQLLDGLLKCMTLDPNTASPAAFAASMRACAMLSNTILTRTLPFLSQGKLLDILVCTPSVPEVYPQGMIFKPKWRDRWAYQAHTHIHLAIQSIMWSPPPSGWLKSYIDAAEEAKSKGDPVPRPPAGMYMLPPLNYRSCMTLLKYAFRQLHRPGLIAPLFAYMQRAFNLARETDFWNRLYEMSSWAGQNTIARQVEDVLLHGKGTLKAAPDAPDPPSKHPYGIELPTPQQPVPTNETTLLLHIRHLGSSGQSARLFDLVYALIPFFQPKVLRLSIYEPTHPDEEKNIAAAYFPATMGNSIDRQNGVDSEDELEFNFEDRKIHFAHLSVDILAALITALEKHRNLALALRVWRLALAQQAARQARWQKAYGSAPFPERYTLPISAYSAMITHWDNEFKFHTRPAAPAISDEPFPLKWKLPDALAPLPKQDVCLLMVWDTYKLARFTWQAALRLNPGNAGELTPNREFFNAIVHAKAWDWDLAGGGVVQDEWKVKQLETIVVDLAAWGLPPMPRLWVKIGRQLPPEQKERAYAEWIKSGGRGSKEEWEELMLPLRNWTTEETRADGADGRFDAGKYDDVKPVDPRGIPGVSGNTKGWGFYGERAAYTRNRATSLVDWTSWIDREKRPREVGQIAERRRVDPFTTRL